MSLIMLAFSSFIIGLSGAMMPGPVLTYVINGSLRRGFIAGPLVVVGHSLLELILVVLLLLGLSNLFANPVFGAVVGLIGGVVLFLMAIDMIRVAVKKQISLTGELSRKTKISGLVLPGVLISISNPYWIIWWATIGMTYLTIAYERGIAGTSSFFIGHIAADFIWYTLVAAIVAFGRKYINDRWYRGFVALLGLVLVYFGIVFFYEGIVSL